MLYQVYGDTRCMMIYQVYGDIPGVWKWTNAMLWNKNAGVGRGCKAICSECMVERSLEIWGCMHRRDGFGCILNRGHLVFVR